MREIEIERKTNRKTRERGIEKHNRLGEVGARGGVLRERSKDVFCRVRVKKGRVRERGRGRDKEKEEEGRVRW
jgi:hypothetical protein